MSFLCRASRRKQKDDSIHPRSHAEPHSHANEPVIIFQLIF